MFSFPARALLSLVYAIPPSHSGVVQCRRFDSALFAGAAGDLTERDTSPKLCRQLVQSQLPQPPPVNQLADHLLRQLPIKMPVSAQAFAKLSSDAAQHFYVPSNRSKVEDLCNLVTSVINFQPRDLSQEPFVADAVNHCILDPLFELDRLLGLQARIGLKASRNRGAAQTGTSRETPSGQPLRPDGMLFGPDGRRLLLKWEEKDGKVGIYVAKVELGSKTAVWSRLYYGSLEYLLCFAAGGPSLQFYVVQRGSPGQAIAVGSLYDLTDASDRALLAVTVFNLHPLLGAIARSLPASVLPVGQEHVVENAAGNYTRTLYVLATSC